MGSESRRVSGKWVDRRINDDGSWGDRDGGDGAQGGFLDEGKQ